MSLQEQALDQKVRILNELLVYCQDDITKKTIKLAIRSVDSYYEDVRMRKYLQEEKAAEEASQAMKERIMARKKELALMKEKEREREREKDEKEKEEREKKEREKKGSGKGQVDEEQRRREEEMMRKYMEEEQRAEEAARQMKLRIEQSKREEKEKQKSEAERAEERAAEERAAEEAARQMKLRIEQRKRELQARKAAQEDEQMRKYLEEERAAQSLQDRYPTRPPLSPEEQAERMRERIEERRILLGRGTKQHQIVVWMGTWPRSHRYGSVLGRSLVEELLLVLKTLEIPKEVGILVVKSTITSKAFLIWLTSSNQNVFEYI
eukprot:TRINITY_DN2305_c0_g1_i2.p1 TRINITY_DN2305_c0_g1~~TRINITY_DN2305_c0_g1_i2.p1  ORF type:complete len:323 (+),score=117.35 TRINITY_DN2305_c0_g1_i2:103-1071(+)